MNKKVLVSYLEYKPIFEIPVNPPKGDITYLREKFLSNFKQTNVTFQRFHTGFQSLVDLNNDAKLQDMDRLTAIVSSEVSGVIMHT